MHAFLVGCWYYRAGALTVQVPSFEQQVVGAASMFSKTKHVVFFHLDLEWSSQASKYFKPISWRVSARFSTMHKLHKELCQQFPLETLPNFPEKFGLVNTVNQLSKDKDSEAEFLEYRRIMLDAYFSSLVLMESVLQATLLVRFFQLRENVGQAKAAAAAKAQAAKARDARASPTSSLFAGPKPSVAAASKPAKQAAAATKKKKKPIVDDDVPEEAFDDPLAWMMDEDEDDE